MQTNIQYSYARQIISDLLENDLDPGTKQLKFNYKDVSFNISEPALKDIVLILATEYNLSAGKELLKVDRDQLLRSQLFHLAQEAVRLADETKDTKFLRSLTQIYKDLKVNNVPFTADLETFFKCMQDLKPGITKEECIALIKKNSSDDD